MTSRMPARSGWMNRWWWMAILSRAALQRIWRRSRGRWLSIWARRPRFRGSSENMLHHPPLAANADPTFKAKSRSTWEIVRRVAVFLRPYPWMAVGTMVCAILSTACGFAFPYLTREVVDNIIRAGRAERLAPVMFGLLGAFL